MKCSEIAKRIWATQEADSSLTNAVFARKFSDVEAFNSYFAQNESAQLKLPEIENKIRNSGIRDEGGVVCVFDELFPQIIHDIKNNGDKPYLLFYRGNISLLNNINNNVAVIGCVNPKEQIRVRERALVTILSENGFNIVSGLAAGCDTIAHEACLDVGLTKTIAILPSDISNPFPSQNTALANRIVQKGGLLVSEYSNPANDKWTAVKRFVDRDRLQAMFSKAVILTASCRYDKNKTGKDSGSRHALAAAKKYGRRRYAIYNAQTDELDEQFEMNRDIISERSSPASILLHSGINELKTININIQRRM